jgi:hypothetical protein
MAKIRDRIKSLTIRGYRIYGNPSYMWIDGYRFKSANHCGLGNLLKRLSFSQKEIKSIYAFMRSLV